VDGERVRCPSCGKATPDENLRCIFCGELLSGRGGAMGRLRYGRLLRWLVIAVAIYLAIRLLV
jgi:hypothetical protein